jgi:hypothetical protein
MWEAIFIYLPLLSVLHIRERHLHYFQLIPNLRNIQHSKMCNNDYTVYYTYSGYIPHVII